MKAGRELDALVAEKVMELNVQPCRKIGEPLAIASEAGHFERFIPHYSTDIAAAWEVVERIKDQGAETICIAYDEDDHVWEVGWRACGFPQTTQDFVDAETLPLAVCRAALELKGINA